MHTFVQAASRALAEQDSDTLERLAEELRKQNLTTFRLNMRELSGALDVLAKQVKAAETHLGLPAKPNNSNAWNLWEH